MGSIVSRFALTTWVAIIVATWATVLLPLRTGQLVLLGVWAVYVPIFCFGLGMMRLNFFCRAVCRGNSGRKSVALTFDDGPDPRSTPELLEFLKREQIPATFLLVGRDVAAHPEVAARIAAEGHLIGNHSYTHPWYISAMGGRRLGEELNRAQEVIEKAAGIRPAYFRPPSGMTGPHFAKALKRAGLTLLGWDVRSLDTVASADGAVARIVRGARDGSIILLHDGGAETAKLLEIVSAAVKQLRARGFTFERVDRLISEDEGLAGEARPGISSVL